MLPSQQRIAIGAAAAMRADPMVPPAATDILDHERLPEHPAHVLRDDARDDIARDRPPSKGTTTVIGRDG